MSKVTAVLAAPMAGRLEVWVGARSGSVFALVREMLNNHRVLRVATVEYRIPPQFVEWVGR
jgi:hypothetical protein